MLHPVRSNRNNLPSGLHTTAPQNQRPPIGGLWFFYLLIRVILLCASSASSVSPRYPRTSCLYLFAPLRCYFLPLAMHRIQRPPKRIQRFVRRRQNVFLISIGVFFQPSAPSRP